MSKRKKLTQGDMFTVTVEPWERDLAESLGCDVEHMRDCARYYKIHKALVEAGKLPQWGPDRPTTVSAEDEIAASQAHWDEIASAFATVGEYGFALRMIEGFKADIRKSWVDDPEMGFLSPGERLIRNRVLGGESVAVSCGGISGKLWHWAAANKRLVYVGRGNRETRAKSDWGNPFLMRNRKDPVERDKVCDQFAEYIVGRADLMARINAGELSGKLLECHCKPLRCHADTLAELANKWRPKG